MATLSHPKIGRNDPCPCASGKKYKHCCLNAKAMPSATDTAWKLQNEAHRSLVDAMLRFAHREFRDDLLEAWHDFNQIPFAKPLGDDESEIQIFNPWLLFDWAPDVPPPGRRPVGKRPRKAQPPEIGLIARSFIEKKGGSLFEMEQAIFDQATTQPVSFYEVVLSVPGERLVLRDILIGGETDVIERSASRILREGDVCYGQICRLPEIDTLSRLAPHPFPPSRKIEVIRLRVRLQKKIAKQCRDLAAADLIRHAEDIREVYLDMRDEFRLPRRIVNTDGDDILYQTMTFKIGSAQVAFDALAPLAWATSREELWESAELDPDGSLRSVQIDWAKPGNKKFETWDNTILGSLRIDGRTLTAEVNSKERAATLRKEIETRLGLFATYEKTVQKTPEQLVKSGKRITAARDGRSGSLSTIEPELLKAAEEQMQRQTEEWVHQKVPALGNLTPMQVVKNPNGREMVEALLLEWEHNIEQQPPELFHPDLSVLRRSLGLAATP